jgi:hypothetical protein
LRVRRLTPGEAALAFLFGDELRLKGVRVMTGAPTLGFAFVVGRWMVFPTDTKDFSAEDVGMQAWFIHELTHVWQFQMRPIRTLLSWAAVALSGGYITGLAYLYRLPLKAWDRLNLEQQARTVEHGWLLRQGQRTDRMPDGAAFEDYAAVPFFFRAPPRPPHRRRLKFAPS